MNDKFKDIIIESMAKEIEELKRQLRVFARKYPKQVGYSLPCLNRDMGIHIPRGG